MAITRTQIAKQLLAKGGRIGLKPGGPPGGGATSMGSGRDFSGPSGPSGGPPGGGDKGMTYTAPPSGSRDQRRETQYTRPTDVTKKEFKDRLDRARDFRETQKFKRAFTTKTLFDKVPSTLKILSRLIPGNLKYRQEFLANNPQLLEYFNSLTEEEQKSGKLMSALKGITNLDGKTYEDFLAFDKGAPGLKFAGNVGGLGTRSAVRDADGNIIGYKFDNVDEFGNIIGTRGEGEGSNLLPPVIAQAPSIIEEEEPEYINPLSLLTPRIAGTQFAAEGGRIGLFKGAQADASAGKGAMSPGTDTGGGFRGGGGDGPKGPPSVINPPKTETKPKVKKNISTGSLTPTINFFKKFLAHDKFTDQLKARQAKNYHQSGALDFMARFPNINPDVAKMLASGYQNIFEVGRAVADGPGGKTIGNALDTAKKEARLNAVGIDAFSDPTSSLYQEYANMVPESGAVQMAGGGIASLDDMDREGFLLGGIAKGLKKAVKGIKKLAKSPIGKAALGFAAFKYGPGLLSGKGFGLGTAKKFSDLKFFGEGANVNPFRFAGIPAILAGAMTPKEDKDKFDIDSYYASGQTGDAEPFARIAGSKFDFYGGRRASADGGRIEYQEGSKEPVAKKTMPLIDMDGKEKDYRETGGFVDMGRMEKADDVPARLSKNEFVFTADAVRNAGDGSVDKGAEVMYNMMKNLESGGDVSEESQGLEGARKMFQTSQRLEEVL